MSAVAQSSLCVHPESLVLIEALPLCRVLTANRPWEEVPDDVPLFENEVDDASSPDRPLHCAALMTCDDAFTLLQEVGHVVW